MSGASVYLGEPLGEEPGRVARVSVLTLAAVLTGVSLLSDLHPMQWTERDTVVLLAFGAVMVAGELLRLSIDGRLISPLATSATVALALSSEVGGRSLGFGCGAVLTVALLSMVIGVLGGAGTWKASWIVGYAVRVAMIATVAILYRAVPWGGATLQERAQHAQGSPWIPVLAMLAVVAAAQALELGLHGWLRSTRQRRPWRTVVREDATTMLPVAAAAMSTAVVIAIGLRSLHLWALPVFLLPLALMRFAIRRQEGTKRARRQAIAALSQLTDLGGYTLDGHAHRVAALADQVGRNLRLSDRELVDLEAAALLHDIGQVSLRRPIPDGATINLAPRDQQRIADDSADIVRRTGVLDRAAAIISEHPTPYRFVQVEGEEVSRAARVLKVCNAFDDLGGGRPEARDSALERIMLGLGYEYDPAVVDLVARFTAQGR